MFSLPPLPPWNAAHVLLVHFPIALLMLAAPALLFFAIIIPKASRHFAAAAALMLIMGTGLCYLATQTGEAAEQLANAQGAKDDPAIHATLEKHSHMAEASRNYFTYFTAAFLVYLLIITTRKQEDIHAGANAFVLALFLAGNGVLALGLGNAAHEGGELVQIHGITAPINGDAAAAGAAEGDTPLVPPDADVD